MINDPNITAIALNEVSEDEKNVLIKEWIAKGHNEEDIMKQIQEIQNTAKQVSTEMNKETIDQRLSPEMRENILNQSPKKFFNKKWFLGFASTAAVATLVVLNIGQFDDIPHIGKPIEKESLAKQATTQNKIAPSSRQMSKKSKRLAPSAEMADAVSGDVAFSGGISGAGGLAHRSGKGMAKMERMAAPMGLSIAPHIPQPREQYNREAYDKIDANPYVLVKNQPLSTFSVDVDTASYANMRRFLLRGQLPPTDSLRIEEMINYFHYDYNFDEKDHPVAVKVDQAESPWTEGRKLVRVALKADTPSNLTKARKNLVFLMDVSGSMNDPKKLPLLKESMKLLIRKLHKDDYISLAVYAGAAGEVLPPTQVKEKVKILQALERLSAGGSTNGGAGIQLAYKLAKQNFIKNGVNRVILATDGDFNVGTSSQGDLLTLIEEKAKDDIFLTVVGLGMGNYQDSMLEKISNRGNGNYAYIDSLAEANKLFNVDLEKNLVTVAKDVKVQIEFNPGKVQAYRLIGYENRMLKAQDFNDDKKDAGEMGAGHTVTALYEIVPVGEKLDLPKVDDLKYAKESKIVKSNELLTVKVRYKEPTAEKSVKFDITLKGKAKKLEKLDEDFRFATAVAGLGLKLRNDKLVSEFRYRDIENLAKDAKGDDPYDFREEFLEMVDLARQIDK